MGKRHRLFPKASLVQTPTKNFYNQNNAVLLPCPPHRIAPPWEPDHLPKPGMALSRISDQPSTTPLPRHSSRRTVPTARPVPSRGRVPATLPWLKHPTTNTGPLPYLKYQGTVKSFVSQKYPTDTFVLTLPPPDFKRKRTVTVPLTSSKQFVIPPLAPIYQSEASLNFNQRPGAASGPSPLPKISQSRDHRSKDKLPRLKNQSRTIASPTHRVAATARSAKRKGSKAMTEPTSSPRSQSNASSVPINQKHSEEVHRSSRRQVRIATALLGGLDLWPKDVLIKSPDSEHHSNATALEKTSDQMEAMVQAYPKAPNKVQPILRPSQTAILSLTFNNKSRAQPAPSSFNKFISRGTNTYVPWPPNKSTTSGPNYKIRPATRSSPDFLPWARTQSVSSLPLEIWETPVPFTVVTCPDHVAEASLGPDYKVKDTSGPSPYSVHPVIALPPGHIQSSEIPPGLKDKTTEPWGLYHSFEVSRGWGYHDPISVSQSSIPEPPALCKTTAVTVLPLLIDSTPSPGLFDKSSLIAGDHKSRDPFGLDQQQVKAPIYPHTWIPPSIFSEQPAESIIGLDFQALMALDHQSTTYQTSPDSQALSQPNLKPNLQTTSPSIPDHQDEPAADDKAQVTLPPDPDHSVETSSLKPDDEVSHPLSTSKLEEVESKTIVPQDIPPEDPEDGIIQILPLSDPSERVPPSSVPSYSNDISIEDDNHQATEAATFDCQDEVQSELQHQGLLVQNREIPWCLKYIKPYTIEGGTLSDEIVSAIINSIPEEKIKSDICKQIVLRRMKESPPPKSGQRMSVSYTVCLECAAWIPNGCPHVEELDHLSETELLAIPMPLPDSEEEMGVKFVLQMPQKRSFSFFSLLFPEHKLHWPSHHSPDSVSSSSDLPTSLTVLPSSSFSEIELRESPKVTWLDLILGKDRQPLARKSSKHQLPSTEETLVENNDDGKEKSRVHAKGFKSLLEKFQKQMQNC